MASWIGRAAAAAVCLAFCFSAWGDNHESHESPAASFEEEVFPLLTRRCAGCHNAAEPAAGLSMSSYADIMEGGGSGAAVLPGKPDESLLYTLTIGEEPSMPMGADPLSAEETDLLRRWILEGASEGAADAEEEGAPALEPPVYRAAPVISALAYSPDGKYLAVSGYREVLLVSAEDGRLAQRFVGEARRISSLAFSEDGASLLVSAGTPAKFGEAQLWDVAAGKLRRAVRSTQDTIYGASLSPDGKLAAFGCADKTARIVSMEDGTELLKFENHSDWVFGTMFSLDGSHIVTGGRDGALKLVHVERGQFIDDINASNKGYGGVNAVARRPGFDQVLSGGMDRVPRLYRIFRERTRDVGNTDFNLARAYEAQGGMIYALGFSRDGSRLAVGSAGGEARAYETGSGKRLSAFQADSSAAFALAFHPDGKRVAAGGFDGMIRVFDPLTGKQIAEFNPFPMEESETEPEASGAASDETSGASETSETGGSE